MFDFEFLVYGYIWQFRHFVIEKRSGDFIVVIGVSQADFGFCGEAVGFGNVRARGCRLSR